MPNWHTMRSGITFAHADVEKVGEMKYSTDRKIVRELLMAANVNNTLSGGMSQPEISFKKESDRYLITASVPGVSLDKLQIEIVERSLILFYVLEFEGDGSPFNVPHVLRSFEITADIDFHKIQAIQEDGFLKIIMPFNELADGYNRNVEIQR